MQYANIVKTIADILKDYDSEQPTHKSFQPGIGPFGEPQIVSLVAQRLTAKGIGARTRRTPDLAIGQEWAIEFKIVRPYGDNGLHTTFVQKLSLTYYTHNLPFVQSRLAQPAGQPAIVHHR